MLVAQSIYHDFPDKFDRKLVIGDACNYPDDCDGHPHGTHSTLHSFDMNYYTMNDFNTTQYFAHDKKSNYRKLVNIWNTRNNGVELLPNMFDAKRNALFVIRYAQIFPKCKFLTNDALMKEMSKSVRKYYSDYNELFFTHAQGGPALKWNHHTHYHITTNKAINLDFDIRNFAK